MAIAIGGHCLGAGNRRIRPNFDIIFRRHFQTRANIMSKLKARKPIPLKLWMLAVPPALAAGWLAMHLWPDPKAQAEAQTRAMVAAEAAEYRCLKSAGLHPDARSRVLSAEAAAALARCRAH
jgi:hypothetical protein